MSGRNKFTLDFKWSILNNDLDAVRRHLKGGVDPNKADDKGWAPLISAASAGSLPVVQLLVDRGADVNHGDIDGFSYLMGAAGAGHADVIRFLVLKGAKVNRTDNISRTALSWAVTKKDVVNAVKALLELGADPNHLDGTGMTPLMRAAVLKFPGCFRVLLEGGADVSVKHIPTSKTALDMAAESGSPALIDVVKSFPRDPHNR
jgi:ankyrin repeat protein